WTSAEAFAHGARSRAARRAHRHGAADSAGGRRPFCRHDGRVREFEPRRMPAMKRRELLKAAAALPLLPLSIREALARALDARTTVAARLVRPRPGSAGWPSP